MLGPGHWGIRDIGHRIRSPTQSLERLPGTAGKLEVEGHLGIAEIALGDLSDPLQPVLQRAPMDGQCQGRTVVVAAGLQILVECVDEIRVTLGVVLDKRPEPLGDIPLNLA